MGMEGADNPKVRALSWRSWERFVKSFLERHYP